MYVNFFFIFISAAVVSPRYGKVFNIHISLLWILLNLRHFYSKMPNSNFKHVLRFSCSHTSPVTGPLSEDIEMCNVLLLGNMFIIIYWRQWNIKCSYYSCDGDKQSISSKLQSMINPCKYWPVSRFTMFTIYSWDDTEQSISDKNDTGKTCSRPEHPEPYQLPSKICGEKNIRYVIHITCVIENK